MILAAWLIASAVTFASGEGMRTDPGDFRIPIRVDALTTSSQEAPLFVAVPFPRDWTVGPVSVVDQDGSFVPSSSRVMARWPESEAIRWMGVDFLGSAEGEYSVVPGRGEAGVAETSIRVVEEADGWEVQTGPGRFFIPQKGALIREAWVDRNGDGTWGNDELVLQNTEGDDLYVVDQAGVEAVIGRDDSDGQAVYETGAEVRGEQAPVLRAVFKREGWYVNAQGERMARHITRLQFFAGSSDFKVEHALVIARDTGDVWFREYGLRLAYAPGARPNQVHVPEGEGRDAATLAVPFGDKARAVSLFQEKAFSFSKTDREKDCRFQIARESVDGTEEVLKSGPLAGNWMLAANDRVAVGVALRNFWQTFPKEILTTHEAMTVLLWSPHGGLELDFRPDAVESRWPEEWFEPYADAALKTRIRNIDTNALGLSRSHDLVVSLAPAGDDEARRLADLAARVQDPVLCLVDPAWLRFSEAMGKFHPYDPTRFPDEEAFMEEWFDQHMAIWRQWGDYGFFEFGNWPHVWYRQHPTGPLQGRWIPYVDRYSAMMDYGFYANVWRMYARTGKRKYFDAAEETSRNRLDFGMAHWDELQDGKEATFDQYRRFPRRLKGTYVFSNSPITWGGKSIFHHNSGTDLRALAWRAYLLDDRRARDMLTRYGEAAKRVWDSGERGPFRGTRPFASLKNLATVYQETGDPQMRAMMDEQVQWLADLQAPQGVGLEKETTGFGKYGVKAGAMHRVHEVSGHELAGQSLTRGATTRAHTSMGEEPFSYVNVEGEQLAAAYRLTGDPVFLRTLRRDMAVAVSKYRDPLTEKWRPMWMGVILSASNNTYPMGGMAYAMDAIVEAERSAGTEVPLTPFLRQGGFGRKTLAVVEKRANEALEIELRSDRALQPVVYDATGKLVPGVSSESWQDQFFTMEKAATRWVLRLPASLPAGSYVVDSGGRGALWEVTWANADKAVLFAPGGFVLGSGDRQWGNRVMPGPLDHNAPATFWVPEGVTSFEISASGPVRVQPPSGESAAYGGKNTGWQTVAVPEDQQGKLWSVFSEGAAFVQLRGLPPYFSYGLAERFFLPELGPDALGLLPDPSAKERPVPDPEEGPFVKIPSSPGEPQEGLLLSNVRLQVPTGDLITPATGTMECWLLPRWSSVEAFQSGPTRTLMDGGTWKVLLHRFGEMAATATVVAAKGSPKPGAVLETNAGAVLERGQWTHLALQWRQDDGHFSWELFVNGRKQVFGIGDAGMAAVVEGFIPEPPAGELVFGGPATGRGDLDAVLGGLRFSKVARYRADFDRIATPTLERDAQTTGVFLFSDGQTGPAHLLEK